MDPRIDILLAMLERHRNEVAEAYEAVPEELLEASPPDGGWSAAQVMEHLEETERMVTKLVARFVAGAAPRPADQALDEEEFRRSVSLPFFLDRSQKVQGMQPPGSLSVEDAWAALEASRQGLLGMLESARGLRLEDASFQHPFTGQELNAYQWIAFVALHEGRHAAQVREIKEALAGE